MGRSFLGLRAFTPVSAAGGGRPGVYAGSASAPHRSISISYGALSAAFTRLLVAGPIIQAGAA